jgi:S1-C subfamily serine protease
MRWIVICIGLSNTEVSPGHRFSDHSCPSRVVCLMILLLTLGPSIGGQDKAGKVGSLPPEKNLDVASALKSVVLIVVHDKAGQPIRQGSGFFVDANGKLVTNFHVIRDAAGAVVKSSDGAFYQVAGVLKTDKQNDLAVLRVLGKDFRPLPLGDSDAAHVGDKVLAIGSPLGLDETVSDGLISGIRDADGFKVFQTTAAISSGSSGGALLNLRGQVIGVTTAQLTAGQNLNFAIPVNYVKSLLDANVAVPFSPPVSSPVIQQQKLQPEVSTPLSIPRYWMSLDGGSTVEVSVDGEYLYEIMKGQDVEDGYIKKFNYICELKRKGGQWAGECKFNFLLNWGSLISKTWCPLSLEETVTSVSPTRIEGISQEPEPGPRPESCPRASSNKSPFTLIPKY